MKFFLLVSLLFILGCTSQQEPLPDLAKYEEDSVLLIKTSEKFANEPDVNKLYKVALAMQTTRTLSCIDFNNECSLFEKFLSATIKMSEKGSLSSDERKELRDLADKIKIAADEGRSKLREKSEN